MSFVVDENGYSVNIDDTRPAYRVLSIHGFYADDHLYPENGLVYFEGEPNEEMEALTPVAHERLVSYIEKLDALAKAAAEKTGRPYVGRPRSFDGQLALATEIERSKMSIMGTKTGPTVTEAISGQDRTPEAGSINPKAGKRGRPAKQSLSVSAA